MHGAIEFTHVRGAIDQEGAVGLRVHVGAVVGGIGGELSYDLLEQILQGGEPFYFAVLVDNQPDSFVSTLEVEQLRAQPASPRG